MPIDLTEQSIILSCVDDTIIVEKKKLKLFNYFNIIFRDEPDIKEIKLDEYTKDILPVLKYVSTGEYKDNVKSISYYYFKWDGIVKSYDPTTKFFDIVASYTDDIYLENKNAFEYFCRWGAYYMHDRENDEIVVALSGISPKFHEILRHISDIDTRCFEPMITEDFYLLKEKYKKDIDTGTDTL